MSNFEIFLKTFFKIFWIYWDEGDGPSKIKKIIKTFPIILLNVLQHSH